jgi:hypothetical protein
LIGPWLDQGQSAIDTLFANPVLSFRQWAFSAGPAALVPPDPLGCFPTRAPPGFTGFDHDRLGITGLIGLWVALGMEPLSALEISRTLLDDSLVVFTAADPAQGIAVAWRLRFTSDTAAISFANSITYDPTGTVDHFLVETSIGQREVLLRAATDPAVYAAWPNAADCGRAEDLPVPPPSDAPSANALRFRPWRGGWR